MTLIVGTGPLLVRCLFVVCVDYFCVRVSVRGGTLFAASVPGPAMAGAMAGGGGGARGGAAARASKASWLEQCMEDVAQDTYPNK